MEKAHTPQTASTKLDQDAINAAGMAPALERDNRQFKHGTFGYWVNTAKKEIAITSACNVKARRSAVLG